MRERGGGGGGEKGYACEEKERGGERVDMRRWGGREGKSVVRRIGELQRKRDTDRKGSREKTFKEEKGKERGRMSFFF